MFFPVAGVMDVLQVAGWGDAASRYVCVNLFSVDHTPQEIHHLSGKAYIKQMGHHISTRILEHIRHARLENI
jgi:hypothetical protein